VYGLPREGIGAPASAHQFVGSLGHPTDAETDLVYMRARYMDPALGRFVSEDPAMDGANWFVYAGNDPVGNVDVDGRKSRSAAEAAFNWMTEQL
jgi:RHS repeat-associated protein